MELTEWQMILVGILASALLWILRLLTAKGWAPSKSTVAIALYVISFGLAAVFAGPALPGFPPFSDAPTFVAALFAWIGQLLALASPIAGLAYLIYNILLKKVLEGLVNAFKKVNA